MLFVIVLLQAKHAGLCALQRSVVLYKLLANLHLHNEDMQPESDRNLFALGLIRELHSRKGVSEYSCALPLFYMCNHR